MRRPLRRLALAFAGTAFLACGKDSTGPSVSFPDLPATLLQAYCVRGDRAPGQGISATLAVDDCPLGDGSYFEIWRIRVSVAGSYRFEASSAFDNLLAVLRVESYTATTATLTSLASDDDSGPGLNALIAGVTLQPGTDYFLIVNGLDASDVGPYSVTFSQN